MSEIKDPYVNGECHKCTNHYLLDCDESRCRAIKLGMSDVMCVQVRECNTFRAKKSKQNG